MTRESAFLEESITHYATLGIQLSLTLGRESVGKREHTSNVVRPMFSKISFRRGDFEASTILWVFSFCTCCNIILVQSRRQMLIEESCLLATFSRQQQSRTITNRILLRPAGCECNHCEVMCWPASSFNRLLLHAASLNAMHLKHAQWLLCT